jgi:hypothetical protein
MMMATSLMTIKCTLSAVCFDGHGGQPVHYKVHQPMQHVQVYSGSHWTPPSGNYSLHIAPAAASATTNIQQSTNTPRKLDVLMAMVMRRYITMHISQWRRSWASLEATGCRHRASFMSDNIKRTWLRQFF